jgi:hypothetical protein
MRLLSIRLIVSLIMGITLVSLAFPHYAQRPLAIDHQPVMPPQPPNHTTIAIGRLLAAGRDDLLVARTIRSTIALSQLRPHPVIPHWHVRRVFHAGSG